MLITITNETADAFETMIEKRYLYPIEQRGHFCIGAIQKEDNDAWSEGLLVFDVKQQDGEVCAHLRWLYVARRFREQGIAKELTDDFFRLVRHENITRIYCEFPETRRMNSLRSYLEKIGFEFEEKQCYDFVATLGQIAEIPALRDKKSDSETFFLHDLKELEWKRLFRYLRQQVTNQTIDYDREGYETEISCTVFEGDNPIGVCLVRMNDEEQLELLALNAAAKNRSKILFQMLLKALSAARRQYGDEKEMHIKSLTTGGKKLIAYFFPEREPDSVRSGKYVGGADRSVR